MAKRSLGLGKQRKEAKKRKTGTQLSPEGTPVPGMSPANQLEIELEDGIDPDDELAQLQGLWKTYFQSDRDDELVLNGIVHECDRMLRAANQQDKSETSLTVNDEFYAIYALALSELTIFKAGQDDSAKEVSGFFDAALEMCEKGLEEFPDSRALRLARAKILLQRIPLEYISDLDVTSEQADKLKLHELVERAQTDFQLLESDPELSFEILQLFDDLVDIVENYGHEKDIEEGLDSDDEDELEIVDLSTKHPLYLVRENLSAHHEWLRNQLANLASQLEKREKSLKSTLFHPVSRRLGQLYLKAAEKPSQVFLTLAYDNDDDNLTEVDGLDMTDAQKTAIEFTSKGVNHLENAKKEDDPQTWVDVAEAIIDLGNLYDAESADQEECYKKAEGILRKANKATHGKFQNVLDNLVASG
ncbi:LAMI_0E12618g1_1 [Lachancea mirantina]|uniref:Enhancer of translation termination 1 n=1 Tax=Lachancea mirantina TaxID=1230905 RepID=A0A1G4JQ71_9SACH|nr:LAMI_0E12618g1_1 [Lachancea mirantina]